ncbi:MAG: AAA family ATPase [Alphaproteobacteria bacterium]|nr:AAA family ATPase [Alphaproteobacteria bacterium]
MKFDRIRLSGFKSFVDPVELDILPGMTGIVGPNGCGKSNLLEALRWVMGETSYKSMRGSGMEDVIFSGTNSRPSRNHAEVMLMLDNSARQATPEYNDADALEVARRIERDAGSAYRINGRDVRARDVQLMFADASTGSRSNSLVKQGQIGEIINSKPEARRRILEEAAGISGLHSRRHEAELRLRGAESNLEKLEETITNLETQLRQLKRQARQASRYKNISGQIREVEALALHLRWRQALDMVEESESLLLDARKAVSETGTASAAVTNEQTNAQAALPDLREGEAGAAAGLRRLTLEQESLDAEAQRANEMVARLQSQIATIAQDATRERQVLQDAEQQIQRLSEEEAEMRASISDDESEAETQSASRLEEASVHLAECEKAYDEAGQASAEFRARKQAIEQGVRNNQNRREKLQGERQQAENTRGDIQDAISSDFDVAARRSESDDLQAKEDAAQLALTQAETAYRAAREAQSSAGEPAREARGALERLVGERDALARLFAKADEAAYPALVDDVTVTPSYETALGAALGDELDASPDAEAPAFWNPLGAQDLGQKLPDGVEPLSAYVAGSTLLTRALSQVGLVTQAQGDKLQEALLPGQKLVSKDGDVWRWDGYCAAADAPTAAATRLAQKNRLDELSGEIEQAESKADAAKTTLETARLAAEQASAAQDEARQAAKDSQSENAQSQRYLAEAEAGVATQNAKLTALEASLKRIGEDLAEIEKAEAASNQDLQSLGGEADLLAALETTRVAMDEARGAHAQARAELDGLKSRRAARDTRLARIGEDMAQWQQRQATAGTQVEALATRETSVAEEMTTYKDVPAALAEKRGKLADLIVDAEAKRQAAADALAQAETQLSQADAKARDIQALVGSARETQARLEATVEANKLRLEEAGQRIREALRIEPEKALAVSGHDVEKPFPDVDAMENKLEKLRRERENLGGVNLRAEEEAEEVQAQITTMTAEHEELTSAINKLRHGIGQLNREGRQRLLAAFDTVNGHFQRLFTQLFGGGTANLTLTESDDPLESGLEIIAHPPGKKPQVMSLLSGGEQALTAMALIFAVFLTNPSPICVLDEVDAPLDDANVERFCNLVKEISEETETRFLLITHHALTMARMDRLFGVTMQERGVSQLLSVDLSTAEQFAESGGEKITDKEKDEANSVA